jgi:hypothetical protein
MKRKNINIQGKDIEVISIGQNSNHIELDDLFNPQSQNLHELENSCSGTSIKIPRLRVSVNSMTRILLNPRLASSL